MSCSRLPVLFLSAAALLTAASPSARADVEAPDPPAADAKATHVTRAERRSALYRRQLVDFYRDHGRADAPWREDALTFLDRFVVYRAHTGLPDQRRPRGIPRRVGLKPLIATLKDKGCDEPMLLYIMMLGDPNRGYRFGPPHAKVRKAFRE